MFFIEDEYVSLALDYQSGSDSMSKKENPLQTFEKISPFPVRLPHKQQLRITHKWAASKACSSIIVLYKQKMKQKWMAKWERKLLERGDLNLLAIGTNHGGYLPAVFDQSMANADCREDLVREGSLNAQAFI
ncbi:hypothetical protein HYC85_009768 [Camellia sinensis]|uniref:Uncharacterized protein n=1 Tax=Camellia sinensis TaxID=4442 RepID=A0A7J7HIL1_CAMSI|nr:hypothetical protein HYC85_009768 [Camellia sinensis]